MKTGKSPSPEERQLKVYPKFFQRATGGSVILPEIRLCGKWLQETGFNCGQTITIWHRKGKLIITPADQIRK